jgi:hypothetical protein
VSLSLQSWVIDAMSRDHLFILQIKRPASNLVCKQAKECFYAFSVCLCQQHMQQRRRRQQAHANLKNINFNRKKTKPSRHVDCDAARDAQKWNTFAPRQAVVRTKL